MASSIKPGIPIFVIDKFPNTAEDSQHHAKASSGVGMSYKLGSCLS